MCGSGSNVSNVEQCGVADKASLAHPLLTSSCVVPFLTGPQPRGWGHLLKSFPKRQEA